MSPSSPLSCSLSTPEFRIRKETVLHSLRERIRERKELADGFSFRFDGTDDALDEITDFVKTERSCCSFFVFRLTVDGAGTYAWLDVTGPTGVKDFIMNELEW